MTTKRQRRATLTDRSSLIDCTQKCQLPSHAALVLSCASFGNLELIKHCSTVCANCWGIRDRFGRTALHIASSCGHLNVVDWLVARKKVRLEDRDGESKWTPLHRSAYFGCAGVCVYLSKSGSNLDQLDAVRCSPLNLLQINSRLLDPPPSVCGVSLFTWGRNANFTLGHNLSRNVPERLETEPSMGNIVQVVVHKFHCVFLSQNGTVYTCGHGRGGRLGHGNENTVPSPKLVTALKKEKCMTIQVAASRDHTVFLTKSGSVYTCGLNGGYQLGQGSKQTPFLSPTLLRSLKNKEVISIGAGRYHTAVATCREILTFGKNLGQLGHDNVLEVQVQPRVVSGIHIDSADSILHLSVSDATTACITKLHHIFVCTGYRVLRCDRWGVPSSLSIVQFCVSANLGELAHKKKGNAQTLLQQHDGESGNSGITVLILDSAGQLWSSGWVDATRKTCPPPQPVFGSSRYKVSHFFLGKSLSVVTEHGEVYTGVVGAPDHLNLLTLTRVPLVQSARSIYTDYKALNFAVLQNVYSPPQLPMVERSTYSSDMYELYNEACLPGSLADVKIKVGHDVFNANKLVLASRSPLFKSIFISLSPVRLPPSVIVNSENTMITIDFPSSQIFDLFLHLLYGGQIVIKRANQTPSFSPSLSRKSHGHAKDDTPNTSFTSGEDVDWTAMYDRFGGRQSCSDLLVSLNDSESPVSLSYPSSPERGGEIQPCEDSLVKVFETTNWRSDVHLLLRLASELKIETLKDRLEGALSAGKTTSQAIVNGGMLKVKLSAVPCDVVLVSEEGIEMECHKCVLVARSDYFQSMLMMGWRESTTVDKVATLKLPISSSILKMIVNYLYTDLGPQGKDSNSIDFLTSALIVSDQLLLTRLKSMCELLLAKCLTLRNAADLAEFAMAYNSPQLRHSALLFVCVNFPSLLEGRLLDSLAHSTLIELTQTYIDLIPKVKHRIIKLPEPTTDQLPQSYLCNETLEFSDDDDNVDPDTPDSSLVLDNSMSGRAKGEETPTRARSPLQESTPIRPSTSNSGSAGRRRRRRKASINRQNDSSLISPPVSPDPLIVGPGLSRTRLQFSPEAFPFSQPIVPHPLLGNPDILTSPQAMPTTEKIQKVEHVKEMKACLEADKEKENRLTEKSKGAKNNPWIIVGKNSSSTLRTIMAEEQQKSQDPKKGRKQLPKQQEGISNGSATPVTSSCKKLMFQKDVEREKESKSSCAQSGNPWNVDSVPLSPQVSLLELMAEEEEQEIKRKETKPAGRKSMNEKSYLSSPPAIQPQQTVSFADIVSSQQKEMDDQNHRPVRKSLALIQVEERAIEGLLQKYSAIDNPDEYITVERCTQSHHRKKKLNMSPKEGHKGASPWARNSYRRK